MRMQIRQGVFETNSSSVHSLTICSQEEYDRWEKGELLFSRYKEVFVEKTPETENDEDCLTQNEWYDDVECETFSDSHTTKSGDKIVAFGYYGYNG